MVFNPQLRDIDSHQLGSASSGGRPPTHGLTIVGRADALI
jgi:hypothetical protein